MGRKTKNRRSMEKVEKMEVDEPYAWEADLNESPELISHTTETNKKKNKSRKNRKAAKAVNVDVDTSADVDVIDLTNDEEINLDEEAATPEDDVVKPAQVDIQIDEDGDCVPELIEVPEVSPAALAENWRQKGNVRFGNGEYHHALDMYTKAIAIHPVEPAYYGNRSACYLMMKKYKEALADARIAIQTDPNFEKGYLRLVRAALALGDVKACQGAVEAVSRNLSFTMDITPEKIKLLHLSKLFDEVAVAKAKKDHRKVVYLCERASEIASGNIQLKMWKAGALSSLGRHSEAQELCTEALQGDSKSVEAIYMYAVCMYQADNLDRTVQFLRQSLQLAPDNADCLSFYRKAKQLKDLREEAGTMFTSGKYSEAKINYLNSLDIVKAPDLINIGIQSKLHFNLALIAQKNGDLDESLNSCKLAIQLNPSYLKAILHQAKIHISKEMFEEAVRDYEAALKIDPKLKDVRRSLQEAKLSAKKAKRKDYYKILNIGNKATEDEIRKAYKKRALVHHPDRHAGATETVRQENERQFKEVGEAYEVLSDPKKRTRYDQGHDLIDSPSADSYDSFDPNTLFNVFFSQGGMGMGGGGGGGSRGGGGFHHFRTGPSYSGFQR